MHTPLKTYWYDKCVGRWTRVEFSNDGATFHLGRNHYSGPLIGAGFIAGTTAVIASAEFNSSILFWVFSVGSYPLFALRGVKAVKRHHSQFPLKITSSVQASCDKGTLLHTSDLQRIVVKENSGRDHVDDSRMVQLYAVLRDEQQFPLLLFQRYSSGKAEVLAVADRLAALIGAQVIVRLESAA